jgi:uncharacterized protein (DUF433 family)
MFNFSPNFKNTINPDVRHGKPPARNMRWPVETILDVLSPGIEIAAILEDHPKLEREEILAALDDAKVSISGDIPKKVG